VSVTLRTPSAGDLAILGGSYLRLVSRGAWSATLTAAAKVKPEEGEPALLIVTGEGTAGAPAPSTTFSGTVRRSHLVPGREELVVSLVAGAGKLATVLGPDDQVGMVTALPVGLVAAAIVRAAGEVLAPGVEQALDAFSVPRWHRMGGTSGRDSLDQFLADVATATGQELGWRFLPDGTIWAGLEAWAPGGSADFVDDDGDDGTIIYAPNGAPLLPGTTIGGARAVEVLYTLDPPKLRARVRAAVAGDPPFVARGLELYRAAYGADVEVQNADGTLDVNVDDARVGGLRSVPIRLGLPGASVTGIPKGARVRIAFDRGSPRGAFACLPDQDPAATIPLALVGQVQGYLTATAPPGGGPCTLAISPVQVPNSVPLTNAGPGHKYARGMSG
jgi:hypothetical protein